MRKGNDRKMAITFFGDPHGNFDAFHETVQHERPDVAIFLGDMGLERPFEQEAADFLAAGGDLWWIVGNHDTDSEQYHDNLFNSDLADRNLGNRVIEVDGVRIAGLGGVFRGSIWHPRPNEGSTEENPPVYRTREDFMRANARSLWRGGMPRKQRSTIFPEDFEILAQQKADILVTHEAPSNHQFGFAVIDRLAERMGVHTIIHGHHHTDYDAVTDNGINVIGVAKEGIYRLPRMCAELKF